MPTDGDNGSGNIGGYYQSTPAPLQAPARRAPASRAVGLAAPKPLETPEEKAAREARNAVITGSAGPAGGFIASGADPMYPAQISGDVSAQSSKIAQQGIATGNLRPGGHAWDKSLQAADPIHPNLSKGEAQAQRQRDFGLGENNNAQTAAMIGNATATGDKYSSAFGDVAGQAGANSAAAGARGVDQYEGDTGQYRQGLANAQQSRGMQTGAYDQLMQFANDPQGPSAAQAQLKQATDANTSNALALARSGRGMGGGQAALRQAIGQNATTQQQSANAASELRANEYTAYQNQRLSAINAAGGVAGQTVAADQNYGQLGLAGAQYQTDTSLKGQQLNDASAQAWAQQQQAALNQGLGAEVGAQTQGLNINSTALAARENEYASANQTYAAEKGFAQAAAIADANRQQAYTGAALSTAGTVIGALSDERYKTNIQPLSTVQPLASQSNGSVFGATPLKTGPTQAEADEQQKTARNEAIGTGTGKAVGGIAGGAVGSMVGPVGTAVGSIAGNIVGGAIGGTLGKVFSDVRSKTNIEPLSNKYVEPGTASAGGLSATGGYLRGNYAAGRRDLDRDAFGSRPIDQENPYLELAKKYGASGVVDTGKAVSEYADKKPSAKALGRFSRSDHPIVSEGDSLLADSARNAPGATYEYADPTSPGAAPGTQTGPMAQDLAAHPLTKGMVGQDRKTGKLFVDGSRAAMTGLAQNHAQQNQLDELNLKIAKLEGLLKRKPGDEKATSFSTSTGGL
ncbi:MAG: hypothetical protein WDO74_17930 [Pseudomonadota bacterium]